MRYVRYIRYIRYIRYMSYKYISGEIDISLYRKNLKCLLNVVPSNLHRQRGRIKWWKGERGRENESVLAKAEALLKC